MEIVRHSHGAAVDCVITEFSKQNDINYLYVTHDVQSGFVTHKKKRNNQPTVEDEELEYIYAYSDEILAWRKAIKLRDDQTMLVCICMM